MKWGVKSQEWETRVQILETLSFFWHERRRVTRFFLRRLHQTNNGWKILGPGFQDPCHFIQLCGSPRHLFSTSQNHKTPTNLDTDIDGKSRTFNFPKDFQSLSSSCYQLLLLYHLSFQKQSFSLKRQSPLQPEQTPVVMRLARLGEIVRRLGEVVMVRQLAKE